MDRAELLSCLGPILFLAGLYIAMLATGTLIGLVVSSKSRAELKKNVRRIVFHIRKAARAFLASCGLL